MESAAERRRAQTRRRKRGLIADAAVHLALEKGLEAATVEAISAAADISTRTFFNYFSAKEDALTLAPAPEVEELTAFIAERPPEEPSVRVMRALVKDMAGTHLPSDEQIALWRRHPELHARASRPKDEERRFLAVITAIAARDGRDPLTDAHPSVLVTTAFGVLEWAVRASRLPAIGRAAGVLIDEAFDLLERGL
ncbi:TetR family transcriptional regulator [Actinorhabdospora filicis]|uniref:TetR family transcriptional regulator n=1 Tax=Actinorhabdospora filicis TaxID=1785913 RepID=A0A9W6W3W9_9ACTN|nr:TetR/AcrR family transcriptional regulator [Actinorhabdospora filicis]GLZ78622.1 TetR family transcriptional regulator [Actinorhabdospora filicis]